MSYALENALFQWQEGERRVRDTPDPGGAALERAVEVVVHELRRRLGSAFLVGELAALYAEDTDWATELAHRQATGVDSAAVVDAAFSRYAREASDYAGGRPRESGRRPETA
jgi:hypothetical protein